MQVLKSFSMKSRIGLGLVYACLMIAATSCTFAPAMQNATPSPDNTKVASSQEDDPPAAMVTPTLDAPPVGLKVGYTAPNFTLEDLQGSEVALSDLRGQAVLMNFWAVWCGFCRVEMPELQTAYDTYGDEEFVVLGIDVGEEAERVASFVQEMGVTFPILLDRRGSVTQQYHIRGLPTSIVIDADGVIRAVHVGPVTQQQIARYLAEMAK